MTTNHLGLSQSNDQVSEVVLDLTAKDVEFGNSFSIFYGLRNNNSEYIKDRNQTLVIFSGQIEVNTTSMTSLNYTVILNNTSSDRRDSITVETLPTNGPSYRPGNYTVFYYSPTGDGSTYNKTRNFQVFPTEGSNIEVSFAYADTRERIRSSVELNLQEQREILVTLTNSGTGNALNIYFDLQSQNSPIQIISPQPLTAPVLNPIDSLEYKFNVSSSGYGIGDVQFSLAYDNQLGRRLTESSSIEFYVLPDIQGSVSAQTRVQSGELMKFHIEIFNPESQAFQVKFFLSSPSFSFSPSETEVIELMPGNTSLSINGFTFANGTQPVTLFMTFIDPAGNDQINVELDSTQVIIAEPQNNLARTLIGIIIFLIIVIIGLIASTYYFDTPIRTKLAKLLVGSEFVTDLNFNSNKIVVDGSNVAWEELTENGKPKIENILIAIDTLKKNGFEEIVVVADAALRYQIENPKDLDEQSQKGIIKVLPAKVDGDSFILRLARDIQGLILTNDLYREYRKDFEWIDDRRVPYSILDGRMYLHPIYDL